MRTPANLCGLAVARLRRQRGFTQDALRQKCRTCGWKVARSVIAKIENQRRTVSDHELVALARALGVRVHALLRGPGVTGKRTGARRAAS